MRFWKSMAAIIMLLISTTVFAGECDVCVCKGNDADTVNNCTECCKGAKDAGITKLEVRISDDGKAIVDQNGKEVAKFVEGTRVRMVTKNAIAKNQKMQGCWNCYPFCVKWNGKRCVEWTRTCDWDFDCK